MFVNLLLPSFFVSFFDWLVIFFNSFFFFNSSLFLTQRKMGNEQSIESGAGRPGARETASAGPGAAPPAAVSTMKNEVSRKFARGATYNMRVIIRGDRNTGKTQLWNRMQGKGFSAAYLPTPQIQTATIDWNHKTASEVIKVEVWDVVDRGLQNGAENDDDNDSNNSVDETKLDNAIRGAVEKKKIKKGLHSSGRGTAAAQQQQGENFTVGTLDATMVDVMRGTSGVIFMFDMTKRWTWEYIQKDIEAAAKAGVSVLVVGNFRDMGDNRVVSEEEVRTHLSAVSKDIWYTEASMKNMFGLKVVSRFLSIPFLAMQRQVLLARLEKNKTEDAGVQNDFKTLSETSNYAEYARSLQGKSEQTSKTAKAPAKKQQPSKTVSKEPEKVSAPEKDKKAEAVVATGKKQQGKMGNVTVKKTVVSAEEEKRRQEEAIKQLKALSNKKASGKSVDDFNPGGKFDPDDIFGGEAVDDDGWITKEPDDDVWGSALNDEEEEEEEEEEIVVKKNAGQKKKKKQTVILDDEDF